MPLRRYAARELIAVCADLRVEGAFLAEAQVVSPRVDHVERALAPGPLHDLAGWFPVDPVRRERFETGCASMRALDVVDREEERLGTRRRRQSTLGDVEDVEDDAAAVEVVPGTGVSLADDPEQLAVELGRALEIVDLDGDPEQAWIGHGRAPWR